MKKWLLLLILPFCLAAEGKEVVVLSQSSPSVATRYLEEAYALGAAIGKNGLKLSTLGSAQGVYLQLMLGAKDAGGEISPFLPLDPEERALFRPELNRAIDSDRERIQEAFPGVSIKTTYINRSYATQIGDNTEAVILFPGSGGAMSRFCEMAVQKIYTGRNKPRLIVYSLDGYWDHLLDQCRHFQQEHFVRVAYEGIFEVIYDQSELFALLANMSEE